MVEIYIYIYIYMSNKIAFSSILDESTPGIYLSLYTMHRLVIWIGILDNIKHAKTVDSSIDRTSLLCHGYIRKTRRK